MDSSGYQKIEGNEDNTGLLYESCAPLLVRVCSARGELKRNDMFFFRNSQIVLCTYIYYLALATEHRATAS
jgi:hypothetical protein